MCPVSLLHVAGEGGGGAARVVLVRGGSPSPGVDPREGDTGRAAQTTLGSSVWPRERWTAACPRSGRACAATKNSWPGAGGWGRGADRTPRRCLTPYCRLGRVHPWLPPRGLWPAVERPPPVARGDDGQ